MNYPAASWEVSLCHAALDAASRSFWIPAFAGMTDGNPEASLGEFFD